MPALATFDRFIDVVRKSGLMDEVRLGLVLQEYQDSGGEEHPTPLATKMVRDGLLSTFQAKQLLQGRWRRFIINNKYKVLDLIGQGGMGAVYLCEHMLMRRLVALKVLPEEKLQQPGALERFQREARAVATLDHPNIVHAYDMDRDEGNMHFMVMEYVDGLSFEVLITKLYKHVGIEPIRAAQYMAQAALGLQHAHESGWVHRDIKPANVLLDRQGVIKILDLGLSRLYAGEDEEQLTKKFDGGSVLGTADYIAPEQALNVSAVDIRADIYSLGATFYFLLTGRPPFDKGTVTQKLMYHQTREPDAISSLRKNVPPEMEAIVKKMMAKNVDERYADPAEVVAALAPWTQTPMPPPPDVELPNHCPIIRNLLPSAASPSRSSGSWSSKSLPSVGSAPAGPRGLRSSGLRTPINLQGVKLAPGSKSGRFAETVVDHAARQAATPKSLPRLPKPVSISSLPAEEPERPIQSKRLYAALVIGGVLFGFSILTLFIVIFLLAL
jgi:serine/threonine protein kinase